MKLTSLKTGKPLEQKSDTTLIHKLRTMSSEDAYKSLKADEKAKARKEQIKKGYEENEKNKPKSLKLKKFGDGTKKVDPKIDRKADGKTYDLSPKHVQKIIDFDPSKIKGKTQKEREYKLDSTYNAKSQKFNEMTKAKRDSTVKAVVGK